MSAYKIAEARAAKGWSQQRLADELGTTQQTIQRYESGARDIKSSVILQLSETLGVTVSYLLGVSDNAPSSCASSMRDVPLLGSIAAGAPIEMRAVDNSFPVPTRIMEQHPNAFLLRVDGESMNRVLPNGAYALVDPCDDVDSNGKPYAVCVNGYDATIKRVRRLSNGFELAPDSTDPTFRSVVYDYGIEGTETITVIGRVVWYTLPYDWDF